MESKMKNPTHSFREMNLVLQLIQELQIKSKTMMIWSSQKKKGGIFCAVYCVQSEFFLRFVFYFNVYSVLNTFSKYTYFHISENITS